MASVALVVSLVLLVGAFDYLIFANIDKLSKRLNPTLFGLLVTAVPVQLTITGLGSLGIISPTSTH